VLNLSVAVAQPFTRIVATTRCGKDQGREILLTNNMLQACALKRAFY
jgi:hypothetical protein